VCSIHSESDHVDQRARMYTGLHIAGAYSEEEVEAFLSVGHRDSRHVKSVLACSRGEGKSCSM